MDAKATLNTKTVAELRKLAAQRNITGRSTMRKDELIRELIASDVALLLAIEQITPEQEAAYAEAYNTMQAKRADEARAAEVAKIRANIDAEEENKSAARRARNRTNYAPAPAPVVNEVAVLRDAPGRAIVAAAFDGRTVGGSIIRTGSRYMLVAGTIKITGNSLEKVAKRFAAKLGFRADIIDIARVVV